MRRLAWLAVPLLLVVSLAATCLAVPAPPAAPAPTPALPLAATAASPQGQLRILPYVSAFLDTDGDMSVEEVAAPGAPVSFQPLHPRQLPRSGGVTWLRLEIPAGTGDVQPLVLDLGQGVPAGAILYTPDIDPLSRQTTWQESRANWRNLLPLPQPGESPQICYVRLDGQPPLWFAPTLRSLENLATAPESLQGPAVMLALAVVMLLALLRGISERGQWRFWTALYVGAALTHAVLGGPDLGAGNITPADAASAMAPGLALMFLAHLARHLMQTAGHSRSLDIQYLILSLPGAVLALLPLWPDFSWLARFLPLWPLLALIFIPTTLGAWLMGVPGARRFLLGCLVAALGAGLALLDLGGLVPAFVQGALPLWGTALSALIIAGMSAPGHPMDREAADGPGAPLGLGRPGQMQAITDPNLRLLDDAGNSLPLMAGLSRPAGGAPAAPAQAPSAPAAPAQGPAATENPAAVRRLEQALAAPLRDLLEQNRKLEHCSLPPAARSHAEIMARCARRALSLLQGPADSKGKPRAAADHEAAFDLQQLLHQAHEACSGMAEASGIRLSWYMPPDLEQRYLGPGAELDEIVRLLLEDAVRATSRGKVHFAVRHVPGSRQPGHLLFNVRDTGTGLPPEQRSAALLARIWELAASHGGFLGVESGPRGTSIIFTLQLRPAAAADAPPLPDVLVCAPDAAARQGLAAMLDDLPCTCRLAASLDEGLDATASAGRAPVAVLLVQGPEAAAAAAPLLLRYRRLAARTGPFGAVALTPDQSRWDALAHAGFSHALTLPVDADALRATVREILAGHDDVADLGAPLPEARPQQRTDREAPLPDLFGPAATDGTGMPELLLDDIAPGGPAPATAAGLAPAPGDGAVPDLFAVRSEKAPAPSGSEDGLELTEAMRLPDGQDGPAAPAPDAATDVAQDRAPDAAAPVTENLPDDDATTAVPGPADAAGAPPAVDVLQAADSTARPAPAQADAAPLDGDGHAGEGAGSPAPVVPAAEATESPLTQESAAAAPMTPAAADAAAHDAAPVAQDAPGCAPAEAAGTAPGPDEAPDEAPDADITGTAPAAEAADSLPARTDGPAAPAPDAATDAAQDRAPDAMAAAAPVAENLPDDATTAVPGPADAAGAPLAAGVLQAADGAARPAPAQDDAGPQDDDGHAGEGTGSPAPAVAAAEAPESPLTQESDAAAPMTPAAADAAAHDAAPVAQDAPGCAPAEAAGTTPGPDEAPDADVTDTAPAAEAADSLPARTDGPAAPLTPSRSRAPVFPSFPADSGLDDPAGGYVSPSPRNAGEWVGEPMPIGTPVGRPAPARAQAAPAASRPVFPGAPLHQAAPQTSGEHAEEWVGEPVPIAPSRTPAFPSFPGDSGAAAPAGGYVSPSLRNAGEWVGEPMPIGTPVSRPAPAQTQDAPTPVETVVTVRPRRQAGAAEEIARQLGKPSLVPTNRSALITPQPRKDDSGAQTATGQPAFPGAPSSAAPQAVPDSRDVSSPPDMTPDTNALLRSGQEEMSRTRAAANTLMRFLNRFRAGGPLHPGTGGDADGVPAPVPVQERQGTPRPIPRKETSGDGQDDIPAGTNPWIERGSAPRPAPVSRPPMPPQPERPQPPEDPDDPLPALMWRLDKYLGDAAYALEQRRLHLVADAAGRLAAEAEGYGFRVLGRMARCVESAGRAKDLQAVTDLLPELAAAVERHRISLDS